ncbi:RT0821/Lpp0805 family surface protein [Methylopila sp. Yamaguchi]|uniref:RT0821/Lpp0805 family surface protein n=1 Tax=Methylopila sp. Yamaguchi TaxID=1437817 RepID=UPI001FCE6D2B|nr:RT0821/Lpp0805 family surface protein [Methylopila sp. Yamaguchi]
MRSLYQRLSDSERSTRAAGPSRAALRRGGGLVAALGLALLAGGCSVSYPLFGSDADELKTGSIRRPAAERQADDFKYEGETKSAVTSAPLAPPPGVASAAPSEAPKPAAYAPAAPAGEPAAPPPGLTASDWGYARGALGLAMTADAVNASVPWANPDSGSYGSFVASAAVSNANGATCRPFVASHSASGREQRLEGTACRTAAGYWEAVAIRTTASRSL